MAEEQKTPPAPQSPDEGIDKQAVLSEIQSKMPSPVPPAAAPGSAPPPPPPGKDPKPEGSNVPVVIPEKPPARESKDRDKSSPEERPPVPAPMEFWDHLAHHRGLLSFSICMSIGLLWGIIGLTTHNKVALVLAGVFIVPNLLWLFTSGRQGG